MPLDDVEFTANTVRFAAYPFPPASIYPGQSLPVTAIRDADSSTFPPEIRTHRGETLFVPATQGQALQQFCHDHAIPLRARPDIWAGLLEPFVDTEFTTERQSATIARLHRAGLDTGQVADTRARVKTTMLSYNAVVWDWFHLGLYDLLDAATICPWVPAHTKQSLGDITELYHWAMAIADLAAPKQPATVPEN